MYLIWNTLFIFIIMLFSCIRYRNSSVSMLAMLDCMKYLSFSIFVAEIKCSKVRKISFLPSTVQEPDLIVSVLASWKCTAASPRTKNIYFINFCIEKNLLGFLLQILKIYFWQLIRLEDCCLWHTYLLTISILLPLWLYWCL